MMDDPIIFTEEALKSQEGKKVPVTLEPGGPVIGEATLHYDPHTKSLQAQFTVDDPKVAEFLGDGPAVIFKKDN
jgi:hypothetical protein